jgi:hypothetical protein
MKTIRSCLVLLVVRAASDMAQTAEPVLTNSQNV